MSIQLIILDADDTLWHNMRHFEAAEQAFAAMLAPFAEAGVARSTLAAVENRNLKRYGYGAKSFTLSMIEAAVELTGEAITGADVRTILDAGRELLSHPVELLDGVAETVEELASLGNLVLLTKGDLLHQEAKLAASGLGRFFSSVEIVSDKDSSTFRRVIDAQKVEAASTIMAGDSLRSDIAPALEAGAWAAYIPQELAWSHESAPEPVGSDRFRRLGSLAELPTLIREIG